MHVFFVPCADYFMWCSTHLLLHINCAATVTDTITTPIATLLDPWVYKCYRKEANKIANWRSPFAHLNAHMSMKAQDVPSYQVFLDELTHQQKEQDAFGHQVMTFVAKCESLDKVQEAFFKSHLMSMFLNARLYTHASSAGGPSSAGGQLIIKYMAVSILRLSPKAVRNINRTKFLAKRDFSIWYFNTWFQYLIPNT